MKISDILALPALFYLYNKLTGVEAARAQMTSRYIKPSKNDKIFDVGCGAAEMLNYFPAVEYHGFDISAAYINKARKTHGTRARLYQGEFSAAHIATLGECDIGIAVGLLHHLPDKEVMQFLELAFSALKPGGRLITFDGCYTDKQSPITHYLLSHDRGRFVRTQAEYTKLIQTVFKDFDYDIRHDLLRMPFTHIIFECRKQN